ncbi:MAG TPA: glycine--tRNA ligase [Nitrososphaeraceae archaeon]|nr:glycine--tRNA ligase [Nitrososphaeraceae archaeon]
MVNYERILKLSLERGFYFPSSDIYSDSPAGFWEYGPNGNKMKNKFIDLWRREMIRSDEMIEIDGSQIMSKNVFVASGHIDNFSDPILTCIKCRTTLRADKYISEKTEINIPERLSNEEIDLIIRQHNLQCPKCGSDFNKTERFNMMFKLGIGPNNDDAYLRPETCQTIFVDFIRIYKTMRGKLPFPIAQVGKSFRNEIAPRQSLLRLREFYQAEIEVFCNPNHLDDVPKFDDIKQTVLTIDNGEIFRITADEAVEKKIIPNKLIGYYLSLLFQFYEKTGIDMNKSRLRKLSDDEKAFYATTAFDLELQTSLGWLELVACNYRSNYDLSQHSKISKEKMEIIDPITNEKVLPHVFELSLGIDRSIYSILETSFAEESETKRTYLKLKPYLSPILVGILPLVKKPEIEQLAKQIYNNLKKDFDIFYDDSGSIGRRYRRLEEIGTPFAITIDYDSLIDNTVTVRYRDTMEQKRLKANDLRCFLCENIKIYVSK